VKEWERQEQRIAKQYGGRRQPGSGSGWLHTNDVVDERYLHEAKQGAKMVTIKSEDWEKLRRNAMLMGREPLFHIQVGNRRLVLHDEGTPYDPPD